MAQRIPGVRYLQLPGSMPRMGNEGQAIGRATEELGQVIGGLGEKGFQIATKLRKMNDAKGISAFLTQMDSQASEFENQLIQRQDYSNWNKDWQSNVNQWRNSINDVDISPEAKAQLQIQFNEWAGAKADRLATTAALKSVETTKGTIANNLDYYGKRGDQFGYNRTIEDARSSGIFREDQIETMKIEGERLMFQSQLDEMALTDPDAAEAFVNSDEFMQNPGATREIRDQTLQQVKAQKRERTALKWDDFEDKMAQRIIRTPEQIDQTYGSSMPPRIIAKMKEALEQSSNDEVLRLRATPEYQEETVGRVTALLDGFNAETDDYDEKFVEMKSLVNTLPAGSAAKEELTRRLNEVRANQYEEEKTAIDLAVKQGQEAFKAQFFGKTKITQSTQSRLDAGFLRSRENLANAGFNEDQIEEIIGDEDDSERDRLKRFRALYPERDKKTFNERIKDPFTRETFEALQRGDSEISYEDPKAQAQAERNLGRYVQGLTTWAKQNPDKLQDGEAISKKVYELISPYGIKNFTDLVLPEPSVLPNLEENPVPFFLNEPPPRR